MKNIFRKLSIVLVGAMILSICCSPFSYAKVSPSNKKTKQSNDTNISNDVVNNKVPSSNVSNIEDEDFDITIGMLGVVRPKEVMMFNDLEDNFVKQKNCNSLQNFIDEFLVKYVGQGAEWFFITIYKLHGDTLNYEKYKTALRNYLSSDKKISSVTKQLLAISCLLIDKENPYLDKVCDDTIGKLGIMSYIYGLHLLNNGCVSSLWTKEKVIRYMLDEYDFQKGYSFMGNETDVDVVSMAVQALAPYYNTNVNVKNMIDSALNIISKVQTEDGCFVNQNLSNSESISQVILMCSILGIDVETDNRFIKNGTNLYMALEKFKTKDGLYGHCDNLMNDFYATTQAFYALGSMAMVKQGLTNLFKINY